MLSSEIPAAESVVKQEILGSSTQQSASLKNFFSNPSYLKSLLVFSCIGNLLLFCGVFSLLTQRESTPLPIINTVTPSPTASPVITESPGEAKTRLQKCFDECETREFVDTLREELKKVQHYKAVGDFNDYQKSTCYGYYNESISPDKELYTYHYPQNCESNHSFSNQDTTINIAGRSYFLANAESNPVWESRTVTPRSQLQIVDALDNLSAQQQINSTYEQRGSNKVRVLTAEGEKVNEFNQLVDTVVQIKVNDLYQIEYFRTFEERAFNQNVRYWDYNVPNKITAPVN
ncbi:MAG: hypothetical protein QY330_03510 [Candidatus Dojkabacteria bacterium]|uniref:Uncharacterized protein n=1 Tax=Candidatus Dojkabacteria bacterium TaxID=2099670 RepID=A0A952AKU0_9BACT|nr:hypothetical protein [Candidatus Dojkabacteria bacterium]WKZ27588.1 MAG: hypothetical protein QY330_03510 [Candidatus Dojkabacteria bacterium]